MVKNTKGFSVIEGLLIIVIVGILGFTGWYVWHSKQNADKNYNSNNSTVSYSKKKPKTESKPADETASWLLYETPKKDFRVRIADGLVMYRYNNLSTIHTRTFEYKAGTKATVQEIEGGSDNPDIFYINFYQPGEYNEVRRGVKQPEFKTNQGLPVESYIFQQTSSPEGIDIDKGKVEHRYFIKGSKGNVEVYYSLDNDSAHITLVEKMVKSLEL